MIVLFARIIGYLFLLAALLYVIVLFVPVRLDPGRLKAGFDTLTRATARRLREASLPGPRRRGLSAAEYAAAMSVLEGYDEAHAERIAVSARRLGLAAGLSSHVLAGLVEASYLHDMGEEEFALVLSKQAPLSLEERSRLEEHPLLGEDLARSISAHPEAPWWVRWHHERVDGTGYPDGLVGDEIPLPARILAVVDAFEAMTHARPYRQALEPQDALSELRQLSGIYYDALLVTLFSNEVFPSLLETMEADA